MGELPISEGNDRLGELEAAEDEADLATAREALSSDDERIPHAQVLAQLDLA